MNLLVIVVLVALEAGIAWLLSCYVSASNVASIAVVGGLEAALMALITLIMSGLWRANVRELQVAQVTEASYDGNLESDRDRGWHAARVLVGQREDCKGPTVAYVCGGSWHRGTPDNWFYCGNIVGHLSSEYNVVAASIGYRRCKTPPLTLYVGYPLYVIGGFSMPGLLVGAVLIPTEVASWSAVVAAPLLLALLYLWLFCFHPTHSGNWQPCMPIATVDDMLWDIARGIKHVRDRASSRGQDERLSIVCHSAGAHLCAFLLLDGRHLRQVGLSANDISAVALICGPLDIMHLMNTQLDWMARHFMRNMAMIPTFGEESQWPQWSVDAALAEKSSLSDTQGPRWLILTGLQDALVAPHSSDVLAESLRELGCDVTRSTFEGGHSPANFGCQGNFVLTEVAAFLGVDNKNVSTSDSAASARSVEAAAYVNESDGATGTRSVEAAVYTSIRDCAACTNQQ